MTRKLFGTDGIRGAANLEPITAATALKVALAAGAQFTRGDHRHRVVIGKDTRLSCYMLEYALTSGFLAAGMDVLLTGPLPTPAIAMLTRAMRADVGVMISGRLFNAMLQYQIAGMNGAGQNRNDNNADKDVIARVVVAPFIGDGPEHLRGLTVGGAVSYGHQPGETVSGTKPTTSSIAGVTETGFTFFPAVGRYGKRLRAGAHAAWFDGPFSVSSEYIQTEESRGSLPDLDTDGAYVGGTWLLTGETKPFNARLRPASPVWALKHPGWGAWEAALRYEYFKLRHDRDSAAASAADNRYDAIVAGLNWYPNEFLRFSVNYLYGSFDHQGKDQSPNPDKRSNNAVLGRAQLEF